VCIQDSINEIAQTSKFDRESVIWGLFVITSKLLEKEPKMQEMMAKRGLTKVQPTWVVTCGARQSEDQAQWRCEGSEYIGKRARHCLFDLRGELTDAADGIIVGWRSHEKTSTSVSVFPAATREPAGEGELSRSEGGGSRWRLVYDNAAHGEVELEEEEVREAIKALLVADAPACGGMSRSGGGGVYACGRAGVTVWGMTAQQEHANSSSLAASGEAEGGGHARGGGGRISHELEELASSRAGGASPAAAPSSLNSERETEKEKERRDLSSAAELGGCICTCIYSER
jgi:hypothetical protein